MDCNHIIAVYEDAACLSRQMLLAARAGNWDGLVTMEKACAARLAPLIADQAVHAETAHFQHRKAALIRAILDDDAQIRMLAEPWLASLSALIGSTRRQSRLHQTYGAP